MGLTAVIGAAVVVRIVGEAVCAVATAEGEMAFGVEVDGSVEGFGTSTCTQTKKLKRKPKNVMGLHVGTVCVEDEFGAGVSEERQDFSNEVRDAWDRCFRVE
jgi:hypothetical protein